MQTSHVAANARNSQKTGTVVDQLLLLAANEYRLTKQCISVCVLCVELTIFFADQFSRAGEQHFSS